MDPVMMQETLQALTEMERDLSAYKANLPLTFMAVTAIVVALTELFVWVVGWVVTRMARRTDGFFGKVGEALARHSTLELVLREVRATKLATSHIEERFSKTKFVSERTYELSAKIVQGMIDPLFACLESRERLLASAKATREETENEGAPFTLPKLSEAERVAHVAVCQAKHVEFRRARAMAPVVLPPEIGAILSTYATAWDRLNVVPVEQWEDDEDGDLERFVTLERYTYDQLCIAARRILLDSLGNAGGPNPDAAAGTL